CWFAGGRRSTKQIDPLRVDAPQVTAARGDTVAIKELQDLDRDLAAVVEPVAQLRGAELAVRCLGGERGKQMRDLGDRGAQEEMVGRHFVKAAHAGELLAEPPHLLLRDREREREVAHPRRAKALAAREERQDARKRFFVLRPQPRRMAWQSDRRAIE